MDLVVKRSALHSGTERFDPRDEYRCRCPPDSRLIKGENQLEPDPVRIVWWVKRTLYDPVYRWEIYTSCNNYNAPLAQSNQMP